ncbi:MAG: DUF3618 domain-containing protein [Solirubrobacteraceae bacterium]|nr:DUF3618 domain-containing protein [Solirubrobacteraceae bacterium]
MGQDPEDIRQQIAETRNEMSGTIDALGYKADVPARAKENVQGKVDSITEKATAVKEKIVGQTQSAAESVRSSAGAAPSTSDVKARATDVKDGAAARASEAKDTLAAGGQRAASVAESNPLGLAIGAVALGFLGGLLIPATRVENEKIGPAADNLKEQVRDAGAEAVQHAQAVASDAVDAATEAVDRATSGAKEAAQDAAESVQQSGKEHAQAVAG